MGPSPFQRVLANFRSRSAPVEALGPFTRARSVCIASGKGGTGKSVLAASLARFLGRHAQTLLVDADLGVGNAHILQGHSPRASLADVFAGRPARELVERVAAGLDLLAGGSGVARLAAASRSDLTRIGDTLATLERDYGYLIADCGAGISEATLAIARAADRVVVVTTPDLTAMTDAYAFLKVLGIPATGPAPLLVVNRAPCEAVATDSAQRVCDVARRFLGRAPEFIGWLPSDADVVASVNARQPFVVHAPQGPAARAFGPLALTIKDALDTVHPRGLGRHLAAARTAARA